MHLYVIRAPLADPQKTSSEKRSKIFCKLQSSRGLQSISPAAAIAQELALSAPDEAARFKVSISILSIFNMAFMTR